MKLDAEKNAARYPRAERAAKSVRMHRGGRQRENHSGRPFQIFAGFGVHRGIVAKIGPVDIGPCFFTWHLPAGRLVDGYSQIGAYFLSSRDSVSQVIDGRVDLGFEKPSVVIRERIYVFPEFHGHSLPMGNCYVNTPGLFTAR